jgi:hypothetical protein
MHARFPVTPRLTLALASGAFATFLLAGPAFAAPETICGRVDAVSATEATVDGRTVPLAGLDAEAIAGLELAFNGNLDACVDVDSTGATVNQAFAVTVSADLCGRARPAPGTDAMVDGVIIPPELLDAETYAALKFAVSINGSACVAIDVTGSGGVSTVDATLNMEVCATVTGVGANTVELNGTSFDVAAGVDLDVEVGDGICAAVSSAAGGGVEITQRTDEDEDDDDGDSDGTGDGDVPDTAMPSAVGQPGLPALLGLVLLVTGGILFGSRAAYTRR